MAKYGSTLAEVKVHINGKEQAKKEIEELKAVAKSYSDQMELANNQMLEAAKKLAEAREEANKAAASKGVESADYKQAVDKELRAQTEYDAAQKKFNVNEKEWKKYQKLIKESEKLTVDLEKALQHLSEQDIATLNKLRRSVEAVRNRVMGSDDPNKEFLGQLNDALNQIVDTIENKKGKLIEFSDIMNDLTNIDDTSLAKAEQRLRSLLAATDKDDVERIKQLKDELSQVMGERQRRVGVEAQAIMGGDYTKTIEGTKQAIDLLNKYKEALDTTDTAGIERVQNAIKQMNAELDEFNKKQARETLTTNLQTSGTADIKQAVDWLTKYQGTLEPLSQEWREVNAQIEAGNARLKQLTDQTKMEAMVAQFRNLSKLSTTALDEQQKYWQSVLNNAEKGTAAYIQAERKLQAISQEMTARRDAQAGAVMDDLANHSVAEIQEAIKVTEQLRDAQKAGSAEYDIYAEEIKKAKEYLQSYVDLNKQIDMEGKWANLTTLSAGALAEQKKYWQEMVNGAQNGSQELQEYQNRLKAVEEEERMRLDNKATKVLMDPTKFSVKEVQEAIKAYEQLRDAQRTSSANWEDYNRWIEKGREMLQKYNDEARKHVMENQLTRIGALSRNALAEQKKFWQTMVDGAQQGSKELTEYKKNLDLVARQENINTRREGRNLTNDILKGNFKGTINETKEAIKALKEYKETLNTTDVNAIKKVNIAIDELTRKTQLAEAGVKDAVVTLESLAKSAENIGKGNYTGSIAGLEEMRKKLIAIRDTQDKVLSPDERNTLETALRAVNKELDVLKGEAVDVQYILANMKDTPLWKLEKAAKQLQEEIRECSENTGDFAKKAAELRQVNAQVEKLKKQFKDTDNVIVRTAKRLASYVLVYAGFNYVKDRVQEVVQANLQLSDSIADVEKTTGLSAEKLSLLGEEIRAIDTRTTQEQLYQLAAAAGQLGLKSETDIAGFVRAANMITVSLNELGTEATTQLMKIATLTGEVQDGTEKALLSIGSAINELTANSAAAAGPIVDLMNRMGGVAAQSRLTSAEMAAIGATADALGQSMEITGTSMNKFLTTLMSDTDQIAYALNMDAKALRSLVNEGKTMDAVISIFERMNNMGGLGELAGVMGDLGSEGARMTQVLAAMASRVDFLKGQVELSTEAYNKATSIQDEYNVKNENAIAILQRMGNAVKEVFVNNVVVDGITAILRAVYQFGVEMKGMSATAQATATAIGALTAALIANRIAWIQNAQARTAAFWSLNFQDKLTWLKLVMLDYTKAIWANIKALGSWTASLFTSRKAIDAVSTAWKGFTKFLSTNWITITIAALGALAAWLIKVKTYVSEAAKATARYNRELQEETDKVDTLFNSLKRLNSTEADRAKTINTINQQYGQYLGFMLDEKDSAEKLAAAHQLINAELRKRMALNLRTTLEGTASNAYAEQLEKSSAGIGKAVENLRVKVNGEDQKERSITTNEVMRLVSGIINKRVAEDTSIPREQLMEEIKSAMTEAYRRTEVSNTGKKYTVEVGADLYEDIEGQIGDLIDSRVEFQKKVMLAEDQANVEMEQLTEDAIEARKSANAQIAKEIEDAKRMSSKLEQDLKSAEAEAKKYEKSDESEAAKTARTNYEQAEKALKDHYTKMVDNANDYVDSTRKLMEDYNAGLTKDDKERMNEEIELYKSFANETAKLVPGIDPWGKGRDVKDWKEFKEIVTNLDTSSATALAAAYKAIKEDTALIPDNVEDFYKMYDTAIDKDLKLQTPENVAKQIHSWAEQIKNKLKTKFGRNTTLGFIFEEEGGGEKKTAKQMYDGWLAALEAYYNERETLIRQKGMEQNRLESEINRELEALNAEKLATQRELEEGLLNDLYKNSTFDPSKFKGVITGTEYFANASLEQMRAIVSAGGPKLDAVIRKNLTDRMVKLEEQAYKIKQRIDKILLEDDFTEKVSQQYLESLDQLGLLFNIYTESQDSRTEEEGERRLAYMRDWSEKAYTLTASELEKEMKANALFGDWVINRKREDYEALLIQLRKFHDDQEEAEKKAADRRKKIFENSETGLNLQKSAKEAEQQAGAVVKSEQDEAKTWDRFKGMDLVSDDVIDEKQIEVSEAQIALYQAKIDASNLYIEQLRLEMSVEKQKAMDAIMYAEQELARKRAFGADTTEAEAAVLAAKQNFESLKRQEALITKEEEDKISEARAGQVEEYQNIADRYVSIEQNKMSRMKEYTDAIVAFSGQMGEAAFGEVEDRKEAGRQLIKTLLTTLKEHMQVKLTELVMEKLFAEQSVATTAGQVSTELSLTGAKTSADIAAGTASATAKEAGSKGWIGLAIGAAIGAALSALLGLAMGAINKSKSVADSISGKKKLATGMLTYAEGNYPVLGNDGKVYDAKYEGAGMKTGIYGGGSHFGIFSEKQPEMIVDGKTTQKLILNYPYIYDAITTIAKNGRLVNAMPTFASGDYPAGMNRIAQVEAVDVSGGANPDMERMNAALEMNSAVLAKLNQILVSGQISANVDPYANNKATKRAERFMKRRGIG